MGKPRHGSPGAGPPGSRAHTLGLFLKKGRFWGKVANKNLLEAAEREGLWAPLQSARCLGEARKSHLAAPILGEVPVQFQVGDGLVEIHPAPL